MTVYLKIKNVVFNVLYLEKFIEIISNFYFYKQFSFLNIFITVFV